MFNLKKQLIKQFIKIKIVGREPGKLTLNIKDLNQIGTEYKGLEKEIVSQFKLLEGIESIEVDWNAQTVTFYYDPERLSQQKLIRWINIVIDTAIDQLDFITKNWETNPEVVIEKMKDILLKKQATYFRNRV